MFERSNTSIQECELEHLREKKLLDFINTKHRQHNIPIILSNLNEISLNPLEDKQTLALYL